VTKLPPLVGRPEHRIAHVEHGHRTDVIISPDMPEEFAVGRAMVFENRRYTIVGRETLTGGGGCTLTLERDGRGRKQRRAER
jgi:hypothetical protein